MLIEHEDNPAGRLATLCRRFLSQPQDTIASEAWSTVLNASDATELQQRYGQLANLVGQIFDQVSALPESEEPGWLTSGIEPVRQLCVALGSANRQRVSQWTTDILPPTVLQGLEACSHALRRNGSRTPTLTASALSELLEDVQAWIRDLANEPELNDVARATLIRRLTELQDSILTYLVGGYDGVESAAGAVLGALVTQGQLKPKLTERWLALWNRLITFAQGVSVIAGSSETMLHAIESVENASHLL